MQKSLIIRNWVHNSNPIRSRRLNMIYRREPVIDDYLSLWLVSHSCLSYFRTWHHISIAGTWTRVAQVKAEYPNQLGYNGLDKIKEPFVRPKKRYFLMDKFWSISKFTLITRSTHIFQNPKDHSASITFDDLWRKYVT